MCYMNARTSKNVERGTWSRISLRLAGAANCPSSLLQNHEKSPLLASLAVCPQCVKRRREDRYFWLSFSEVRASPSPEAQKHCTFCGTRCGLLRLGLLVLRLIGAKGRLSVGFQWGLNGNGEPKASLEQLTVASCRRIADQIIIKNLGINLSEFRLDYARNVTSTWSLANFTWETNQIGSDLIYLSDLSLESIIYAPKKPVSLQ
ncbi:hypothetical protein DFP72DRAFT_426498 [Ephemerocybe angulata]|uniref:Uncharacterized protein n=1 Tax=Ephemerocybe angulata TaxID=980116 RepID=A0A8H6HUT0_9AGAR|nr:hypothetical protein DFP72DRAFT_426498 [Tulosesus angulatus]